MTYLMTPAEATDHQPRYDEWAEIRGYTEYTGRYCFSKVLRGGRCTFNYPRPGCLCATVPAANGCVPSVLDHVKMWRDKHGKFILTAEPYGLSLEYGVPVLQQLRELGLDVEISSNSPWYPGRTIMLIFRKADSR